MCNVGIFPPEELDSCVIYLHIHFTFWSWPLARRQCLIGQSSSRPSGYLLLLQWAILGRLKRWNTAGFIVIKMHEMWNNAQWTHNESTCTAQMLVTDGHGCLHKLGWTFRGCFGLWRYSAWAIWPKIYITFYFFFLQWHYYIMISQKYKGILKIWLYLFLLPMS